MNPTTADRELAREVVTGVGGPANIAGVEHCLTRLRFVLRDRELADRDAVSGLPGVLSVVERGGQFQVVIGNGVPAVHAALLELPEMAGAEAELAGARVRPIDRVFDVITGTFHPLLFALVGASMVTTVLAVCVQLGWIDKDSATYAIWAAAGNAAFTFLPVLVGITAARKMGANPYLGGVIAAALMETHFTDLGPVGTHVTFLGLPVTVIGYAQSVLPSFIAAAMLAVLERWLRRVLPTSLHILLVPTICLAVLVPATAIIFGPLGSSVGDALSAAVGAVWSFSPGLAGAVMGGLWQVFVIFGVHWGFVPVMINDLSVQGYSLLTGPLVAAVLAQGAAAAAVFLRTRNRELRAVSGAATVSAFVAGVTEPAIYGVTLRLRRPFLFACIGGAVGGAVAALGGSAATSFVLPGLLTLPAYMTVGNFTLQLAGTTIAVVLTFVLTLALGFHDPAPPPAPAGPAGSGALPRDATGAAEPAAPGPPPGHPAAQPEAIGPPRLAPNPASPGCVPIAAPMAGSIGSLSELSDPVFASGMLGPGAVIHPSEGLVRAPVRGRITSVARAQHAVGLTTETGVDVLIHVGIDTVQLAGEHFEALVSSGDLVELGDPLLRVDLAALQRDGFDPSTPVVVANAAAHAGVRVVAGARVGPLDPLLIVDLG